jgi:hypothetical protein
MKGESSLNMHEGTHSSENNKDLNLQGLKFQLYSLWKFVNKEFIITRQLVQQYLVTNIHDIIHSLYII